MQKMLQYYEKKTNKQTGKKKKKQKTDQKQSNTGLYYCSICKKHSATFALIITRNERPSYLIYD